MRKVGHGVSPDINSDITFNARSPRPMVGSIPKNEHSVLLLTLRSTRYFPDSEVRTHRSTPGILTLQVALGRVTQVTRPLPDGLMGSSSLAVTGLGRLQDSGEITILGELIPTTKYVHFQESI